MKRYKEVKVHFIATQYRKRKPEISFYTEDGKEVEVDEVYKKKIAGKFGFFIKKELEEDKLGERIIKCWKKVRGAERLTPSKYLVDNIKQLIKDEVKKSLRRVREKVCIYDKSGSKDEKVFVTEVEEIIDKELKRINNI